ncbi:MAG: hypothetical protein Athens101428_736 [Candidatus Berkelbacteria bacterium Athens1014_28]|uniref:Uncharacterized protein n=1 Tax=Candidatus Berkelbacteria bacterium Athens1014_28 TaxID=2017145 RepID=A0A554LKC8_9BACT|nr:MAG: hypothetical protein Athens101428_736 [Candidatus Berkelbacteria bacterium Athens1014_28]
MEFVNDPHKAKVAFVVTLILAIFFFLASGTLGYFYWQKMKSYNDLADSKKKVEESLKTAEDNLAKANIELATLKTSSDASGQSISSLQKQITDNNAKKASIASYLTVFTYLVDLIEAHSGLDGWTETEFQTGRAKAVATGNNSFVADIDWAWAHKEVDQITRLVRVMRDIITGINNGIK